MISAGKNFAGTRSRAKRGTLVVALLRAAGTLACATALSACATAPTEDSVPAGTVASQAKSATLADAETRAAFRSEIELAVANGADVAGLPADVFSSENLGAYADFLIDCAARKNVPAEKAKLPITALLLAFAQERRGDDSGALRAFSDIAEVFPDGDFAAEALFRQGEIYSARRQFELAFECFSALEDSYPASPRADDAFVHACLVTKMVRDGVRPLKGGWLPWFKDRSSALKYYDRLYEMGPHTKVAPRLLYDKGSFAFELSEGWFAFDKTADAIDAFERMISIYPDAEFVPDAYLELARTYEAGIVGADWDQLPARRAISYYTDFYSLFPEHSQAEFAYEKTVELTNLLAANRVVLGDFYYSRHNNLRAALTFYNEALTLAPDSEAGKEALARIGRIRRGERAERTFVDWIFGRYPNYDAGDYFDAQSLKPLDEMGFRSENANAENSAAPSEEFSKPGED